MQAHGESTRPVRWAPRHRPEHFGVTIGLAVGCVVSPLNMSSHVGTGTGSFTQRLLSTTHLAVSLPTYLTPAEMQAIYSSVQFVEPLPRRGGLPYAPLSTRVTTTSCGTRSSSAPSYFSP
ncbi:major facilitator superfamily transporter [Colletotrichum kahawae]|uniref:Major facilitator superfamily transporter n=1 Tax=Colletotrichum kahawae TaxID=34407 RepID=A0AAE0DC28_COLKA|nr:major facilitator superfamily transporter [Colletotrichum kahawae]